MAKDEPKGAPLPLVGQAPPPPEQEARGVANHRVIDLIELDPMTGEVVLMMLEERPWPENDTHLRQLEHKLNSYLGYVLDGYLVRDYPEYADKSFCFRLDCTHAPGDREQPFLTAVRNYASSENIRFVINVMN